MGTHDFPAALNKPLLVAFGDFVLDSARVEVTLQGRAIAVRPKAYALLCYLVAHAGRTVGKQELLAALWPQVVVTDDSLVQCVTDLRAALGPQGARLVTTVPRHGYRFDGVVEPLAAAPPPEGRPRHPRWPMAALAAGLAALGVLAAWVWWPAPAPGVDRALTRAKSLAVLPLVPKGSQTSPEFAEAMTEELIGDIARVPGTTVISRASAATAAAQDQDARRIGKLLDVAYVVSGSVAREEQAMEVTLQFASASTGAVLWSERWRQPDAEAAARRGDIPLRIARALDLQLTSAVHKTALATAQPQVMAAVARGNYLLRTTTAPADTLKARALFQEAIAADPRSARAWSGLALSYLSEIQGRWATEPARQAERAAEAIGAALSIDPEFQLAHYAQGHLQMVRRDPAAALASYARVLAINPSDAGAHVRTAAALLALGRFGEVEAHALRAQRLNPLEGPQVSFGQVVAASAHFHLGRDEAAYQQARAATLSNPQNATAWALMASIDALHDRAEAAAQAVGRLKAIRPQATVTVFRQTNTGVAESTRAGNERFFAGLLKAGLPP